MSQEKYMNNYVDLLKSTLNDQIGRNLQLQATAKTQGEIITEMNDKLTNTSQLVQAETAELLKSATQKEQDLLSQVNDLKKQIDQVNTSKQIELEKQLEDFRNQISQVNNARLNDGNNNKRTVAELASRINELQVANNDLQNTIIDLNNKLSAPNTLQNELDSANLLVENLKTELVSLEKELSHMETLKNQLVSTQSMVQQRDSVIDELNDTIEDLKTAPTKKTKKSNVDLTSEVVTEEGGSF